MSISAFKDEDNGKEAHGSYLVRCINEALVNNEEKKVRVEGSQVGGSKGHPSMVLEVVVNGFLKKSCGGEEESSAHVTFSQTCFVNPTKLQ